jgi:hypothetical protein
MYISMLIASEPGQYKDIADVVGTPVNGQPDVTDDDPAHYEDHVEGNATWSEEDWNGDGNFNSSDLVFAFQQGSYEVLRMRRIAMSDLFAATSDIDWRIDDLDIELLAELR